MSPRAGDIVQVCACGAVDERGGTPWAPCGGCWRHRSRV